MTVIWIVAAAAILYFAVRFIRRGIASGEISNAESSRDAQATARWLGAECGRLASANASWAQVLASINPEQDLEIGTLLARIRATHNRDPQAALMEIEDGCRLAVEQNQAASVIDGLAVTVRDLPALPVVHW